MARKPYTRKSSKCVTSSIFDLELKTSTPSSREVLKETLQKNIERIRNSEEVEYDEFIKIGKYSKKMKEVLEYEQSLRK